MKYESEEELNKKFSFLVGWRGNGVIFEVGDGWYQLLLDTFTEVNNINHNTYTIIQIKEKFGMLEIYGFNSNKQIDQIIAKARVDSKFICEVCGKPGHFMSRNGWQMTRCPDCILK
jgi:hypothetical protein